MRTTLLLLLVPLVIACEPEVPTTPPGQACYALGEYSRSTYGNDCAPQACAPELVVMRTDAAVDIFECQSGSCEKATESQDVIDSGLVSVRLFRSDIVVELRFDRAVLDEPVSLDSLRRHLRESQVSTWKLGLFPVESSNAGFILLDHSVTLDDFGAGVLTFHIEGQLGGLGYENPNGTPRVCLIGHFPEICTTAHCFYPSNPEPGAPVIDVAIKGTAKLTALVP